MQVLGLDLSVFFDQKWRRDFFERANIVINCCILVFGLYSMLSETFWPSFIQETAKDLVTVAKITLKKGTIQRRLSRDTLWLPLQNKSDVYTSDLVMTEKNSLAELKINDNIKFTIEPESMVRINMKDGKPLINIASGSIKTTLTKDTVFLIKKGSKIEEVLIRSGTYFVKNDSTAGLQITSFAADTGIAGGEKRSSGMKAKAGAPSDDGSAASNAKKPSEKLAQEKPEEPPFDLPTPADSTVFLVKRQHEIVLGSKPICPDTCELQIYRDNNLVKSLKFNSGDQAVITLNTTDLKVGSFIWKFESQTSQYQGSFAIRDYSETELSKAIEQGQPVEILQ